MSTEQQLVYGARRLIVFPKPGSTGIWCLKDEWPQMVRHDVLGLPLKLSNDFNDFVLWAVDAALSDAGSDVLNRQFYEKGRGLAKELAQFVGDSCQVEFLKQRILPDLDIEPLSREFIFDKRYASQRNKRDFYSPVYRTYLAALLWCDISEDDRERIFPGMFDLGSRRITPVELCNDAKLAEELGIDVNDHPFKSVKEGIARLLGCEVSVYMKKNPSTTYKIIKLMYRMLKDRHNRLFHFLKLPDTQRHTLEFRDATPFVQEEISTEEAVWLIADLKTYLSMELNGETFIAIQTMFDDIPRLLDRFRHGTEQVFVEAYGGNYGRAGAAYAALADKVKQFKCVHEYRDVALDEELCVYMQSLEFFHYAFGARELFDKSIPDLTITPVIDELTAFTRSFSAGATIMEHLHVQCLSIDDVPKFLQKNWKVILLIASKAMGTEVKWSVPGDAITAAHSLVHNFFWFLHEKPWTDVDTKYERVSPWICVAALCCVWHMMENPLSHPTYLRLMPRKEGLSVKEPTRSLLTALKDSQHEQVASDRMTLEHRHIWRHRLEWFCDSLIGQSEMLSSKFEYRIALASKLIEILRGTRNRDSLEKAVNDFYYFVKDAAFKISSCAQG